MTLIDTSLIQINEKLKANSNALYDLEGTIAKAQSMVDADVSAMQGEERGKLLPTPSGWRILVTLPEVAEKSGGGVIRPDQFRNVEQVASNLAFVLALGPDAYGDKAKFPSGPWCKKGDFVILRSYSGTRFRVNGVEFRLVNDDQVEAVIDDPRAFSRM